MSTGVKLRAWLVANRTSVRISVGFRLITMAVSALLSLLWYRLLLQAMGDALWGLFSSFQAAARLGGLGDLGISGGLGLKTGILLGRAEDTALRKLLASARLLFLLMAVVLLLGFAALSPWLPQWLNFKDNIPGAGSLPLLFVTGGIGCGLLIIIGYVNSLNYANSTIWWISVPAVLLGQLIAPLLHWLLARHGAPLWIQNTPYLVMSGVALWVSWLMLKWSHPWLSQLRPLKFDFSQWKSLAAASGWVYLCSLGNAIYVNTDRLVINAGFGPAILPTYQASYKACELLVLLIVSASFASLPKITQWLNSPDPALRTRLLTETNRLNVFQIVLGCGAALGYLAFNDLFVRLWLGGTTYLAPFAWQVAFACNLAVTVGGDAGIQISTRCGDRGIRTAGIMIGATGLLNLGLSLLAMKLDSITGIAVATVIAQSALSIILGYITCRHLGLSVVNWLAKSWLLPLALVLAAGAFKTWFPGDSLLHFSAILGGFLVLFLVAAGLAGMNRELIRSEIATLRAMLRP